MKVTGLTFIRNAVKHDYPIVEAINSILPLCDAFIVALGNSEDETEALINNIGSSKIKIINTEWNELLREGGAVLADETNKALDAVSADTDWCFYIQGDEVMHEQYIETVKAAMLKYENDKQVEGLLFKYRHFYGSYAYEADSRKWYRNEIRVVRNDKSIRSYKDAQGFRKRDEKLQVKEVDAYIYHYGWVKNPMYQVLKAKSFSRYWHSDEWIEGQVPTFEMFDYSEIDSLKIFEGTAPEVMKERIAKQDWKFEFDISKKKLTAKNRISNIIEKWTGKRIGEYKNYKKI